MSMLLAGWRSARSFRRRNGGSNRHFNVKFALSNPWAAVWREGIRREPINAVENDLPKPLWSRRRLVSPLGVAAPGAASGVSPVAFPHTRQFLKCQFRNATVARV